MAGTPWSGRIGDGAHRGEKRIIPRDTHRGVVPWKIRAHRRVEWGQTHRGVLLFKSSGRTHEEGKQVERGAKPWWPEANQVAF